jgi:aminoglycoside phosphotransferase (APT) family kinase protein
MTGDRPHGRLIGSGRAADVYELGGERVLRRYRIKADVEHEARLMRYLWSAGFPVPEVYDADGTDMVLARLRGIDMLTDLTRRPWRARRHAMTLARMHDQLHEIPAPAWLPRPLAAIAGGSGGSSPRASTGDRVVHLDLHLGNVVLARTGPVVIDWSNGAAGPPGADVAMAALIMRISEVDELPLPVRLIADRVRRSVVRQFERSAGHDGGPWLVEVAKLRLIDRNVRPAEADVLRRMIDGRGLGAQ